MVIEEKDSKGCVSASNQDRDIGVIDPAPDRLGAGAPRDPVVEGAAGKEDHRRQGEDSEGNSAAEPVSHGNQGQASHQAEGAHH